MGVSDLSNWANKAGSSKAPTGRTPDSTQIRGLNRPASTSGTRQVPTEGAVKRFDRVDTTDMDTPQPPKHNMNGGRAGAKSGQPKIGSQNGNNRLMSGGSAG